MKIKIMKSEKQKQTVQQKYDALKEEVRIFVTTTEAVSKMSISGAALLYTTQLYELITKEDYFIAMKKHLKDHS